LRHYFIEIQPESYLWKCFAHRKAKVKKKLRKRVDRIKKYRYYKKVAKEKSAKERSSKAVEPRKLYSLEVSIQHLVSVSKEIKKN
jgi:hypothetical protein